jgi:hypothetical protein
MIRIFGAALVFIGISIVASAESLTLAPKYGAVGINPDGSKYTGTATIQIPSDKTFAIQWLIDGVTYKGFGMRRNDALAATYMINGKPGLVIYQVDGDGLDGLWAITGVSPAQSISVIPRSRRNRRCASTRLRRGAARR